jgi:quercetin dioxygenase-like cupin family protein
VWIEGDWQGSCKTLDLEKEAVMSDTTMSDTTVTKVDSRHSPVGALGQTYLASGVHVAMRLWEEGPAKGEKPESRREYETVGYVIAGRAELHLEGQTVILEAGDSWVVPKGASHTYRILEPFKAVEATSPPAQAHGRDEPSR